MINIFIIKLKYYLYIINNNNYKELKKIDNFLLYYDFF